MRPSTYLRPALLAGVAALTLAAAGQASAATVLSAGWNSDCGTSTCFDAHGTYAVTFSASMFHGPVDISKLLLDRSVLGSMDNQYFSLSFMLNGHKVGSWGNWNMSQVGGDQLSFSGQDLMWNPGDGDLVLVMDLVAPNGEKLSPDGHGGWFVPGGMGGGGSAAAPAEPDDEQGGDQGSDQGGEQGGGFGDGSGDGVVTIFFPNTPDDAPNGDDPPNGDTPPPSGARSTGGVPEPATWGLMLGGFGLAGMALRRRRAEAA